MRLVRTATTAGLTAAAISLVGALPAAAAPPTMPWHSPNKITSGVPVDVSSIAPCPTPPNPGDPVLVQVTVTFSGGGMGQVVSANSDGSWSGQVTYGFSGTPRQASISAECQDFNGVTGIPYAEYQTRHTQLFSS